MSVRFSLAVARASTFALIAGIAVGGCASLNSMMPGAGETGPVAVSAPATLQDLGGGRYRVAVPMPDEDDAEGGRAALAALLDEPGDTMADLTDAAVAQAEVEGDDRSLADAAGEEVGRNLSGDAIIQTLSAGRPAVVKFAGRNGRQGETALVMSCTYSRVDRSTGTMLSRLVTSADALDNDEDGKPSDAQAAEVMGEMTRMFNVHEVAVHDPRTGRGRTMSGEEFLEVASLVVGRGATDSISQGTSRRE